MTATGTETTQPLRATIDRQNEAWNRHDVDTIAAMHAADMVFEKAR